MLTGCVCVGHFCRYVVSKCTGFACLCEFNVWVCFCVSAHVAANLLSASMPPCLHMSQCVWCEEIPSLFLCVKLKRYKCVWSWSAFHFSFHPMTIVNAILCAGSVVISCSKSFCFLLWFPTDSQLNSLLIFYFFLTLTSWLCVFVIVFLPLISSFVRPSSRNHCHPIPFWIRQPVSHLAVWLFTGRKVRTNWAKVKPWGMERWLARLWKSE